MRIIPTVSCEILLLLAGVLVACNDKPATPDTRPDDPSDTAPGPVAARDPAGIPSALADGYRLPPAREATALTPRMFVHVTPAQVTAGVLPTTATEQPPGGPFPGSPVALDQLAARLQEYEQSLSSAVAPADEPRAEAPEPVASGAFGEMRGGFGFGQPTRPVVLVVDQALALARVIEVLDRLCDREVRLAVAGADAAGPAQQHVVALAGLSLVGRGDTSTPGAGGCASFRRAEPFLTLGLDQGAYHVLRAGQAPEQIASRGDGVEKLRSVLQAAIRVDAPRGAALLATDGAATVSDLVQVLDAVRGLAVHDLYLLGMESWTSFAARSQGASAGGAVWLPGWARLGGDSDGATGFGRSEAGDYGFGSGRRKLAGLRGFEVESDEKRAKNVVRTQIRAHLDRITSCYEQRLTEQPELAGTVVVTFQVSASGQVVSATGQGMDDQVSACVAAVVHTLRFPAWKHGDVEIKYPFTFRPAKE